MFKESASIGHILPMPIPPKIADTCRCRLIGTSLISGTTFLAMGVQKLLYNVIFIWWQNISWQLHFFHIFQNFALENL